MVHVHKDYDSLHDALVSDCGKAAMAADRPVIAIVVRYENSNEGTK